MDFPLLQYACIKFGFFFEVIFKVWFTKLGINKDKGGDSKMSIYLHALPLNSLFLRYMHALSKCTYLYGQNARSAIKETKGKS